MRRILMMWKEYKKNKNYKYTKISASCFIEVKIPIGEFTEIGSNTIITRSIESIGKYCSISYNVNLGLGMHPIEMVSSNSFFFNSKWGLIEKNLFSGYDLKSKTTIGNDVWIGTGAFIMPQLKIGDGAIIGAGAVVTKDVPPYAIAAGNPAKIIRYRFKEEQIEKLLKIQWWNWSIDKIKKNLPLFTDIEEFLRIHGEDNEKL